MADSRMTEPTDSLRRPIFVRATGAGAGGIATLILDGEGARLLLQPLLHARRTLFDLTTGDLLHGRLAGADGQTIDEVVAAPLGMKDSESGNEQIELSCHGGTGALAAVEEALANAGFARGAHADLLKRGHLHGVLSLVTIEARLRLATVATPRQAEFLLGHTQLQERWERLGFDMALGMRESKESWRGKLLAEAEAALKDFGAAERLLARHHVVLVGPVNAGKSTLANRLARAERHIVCEGPGTTRDRLDTPIELRGLSIVLTDTAGLRASLDDIEREGQRRGQEAARQAALRLAVLDACRPPSGDDVQLINDCAAAGAMLLVLNKQDLGVDENAAGLGFVAGREPLIVSAKSGAGLEELMTAVEAALLGGSGPGRGAPFTKRQARLLEFLKQGLEACDAAHDLLPFVRRLVGTRPDADELTAVLRMTVDEG
jgi:tRNA modification GTPase